MPKNRVVYQKTLTYRMGHVEKLSALSKNINLQDGACRKIECMCVCVCVCVCVCRMENRNQANQDERMNEAPSASAGNGLFQFYYSLINIDERE